MPWKDKEKRKEYLKEYYRNNKEKILEKNREYSKDYRENNKEKIKEYNKGYSKTEACRKTYRIYNWIQAGVKSDDYDSLYEVYINTKFCEECNVELVEGNFGNNRRCLDHDHETGLFRNVVCHLCNCRRG